jgi:hypothetical protein
MAGYFLIGLHAAAALFHHYARRDNTLRLMWRRRLLLQAEEGQARPGDHRGGAVRRKS